MVFPARAGMIPTETGRDLKATSIPRESGDDPITDVDGQPASEYSPRERG